VTGARAVSRRGIPRLPAQPGGRSAALPGPRKSTRRGATWRGRRARAWRTHPAGRPPHAGDLRRGFRPIGQEAGCGDLLALVTRASQPRTGVGPWGRPRPHVGCGPRSARDGGPRRGRRSWGAVGVCAPSICASGGKAGGSPTRSGSSGNAGTVAGVV